MAFMTNNKNTDDLRGQAAPRRPLDDFDRKILGALVRDASLTYAALGEIVNLSAPAVYERVRRLRKAGILRGTTAMLDGAALGKPFLAFVLLYTNGWGKSQRMMKIADYPEVEEIHSVAGDASVLLKLRTENARALEVLLSQLYALPGVISSKSHIVLSTYLERPVQAERTERWPETALLPPEA